MYVAYVYRINKKTRGNELTEVKGNKLCEVMDKITEMRQHNDMNKYEPYRIGSVINTAEV